MLLTEMSCLWTRKNMLAALFILRRLFYLGSYCEPLVTETRGMRQTGGFLP